MFIYIYLSIWDSWIFGFFLNYFFIYYIDLNCFIDSEKDLAWPKQHDNHDYIIYYFYKKIKNVGLKKHEKYKRLLFHSE
jgi:hypothetical protein